MQVQNYHGVLNRLVPCLKCIKLAFQVLHSYFGLIIYLRLVKVMTKTLLLEMTWLYLTKEKPITYLSAIANASYIVRAA